jgi:dihydrofolate reductase
MSIKISMIAAMDANRGLGFQGKIQWQIPADFSLFRNLTMGKPVIMGRKTHQSIGRLLPGRPNIVLTRDWESEVLPQAMRAVDASAALWLAQHHAIHGLQDELFIIGGQQIYEIFMPKVERIYLTRVHRGYPYDAQFPEFEHDPAWVKTSEEYHPYEGKQPAYTFQVWDRGRQPSYVYSH